MTFNLALSCLLFEHEGFHIFYSNEFTGLFGSSFSPAQVSRHHLSFKEGLRFPSFKGGCAFPEGSALLQDCSEI